MGGEGGSDWWGGHGDEAFGMREIDGLLCHNDDGNDDDDDDNDYDNDTGRWRLETSEISTRLEEKEKRKRGG